MNTIKPISEQEKNEIVVKIVIYPTVKEIKAIISEQNPTTVGELIDRQVDVDLLPIWSLMNDSQKTIVKGFFKELAAQALEVDSTEIIGEFTDEA